jgi:hypothetical protein
MTKHDRYATRAFKIWHNMDAYERDAFRLGAFFPCDQAKQAVHDGYDALQLGIELLHVAQMERSSFTLTAKGRRADAEERQ